MALWCIRHIQLTADGRIIYCCEAANAVMFEQITVGDGFVVHEWFVLRGLRLLPPNRMQYRLMRIFPSS